jgi:hypothetical protein
MRFAKGGFVAFRAVWAAEYWVVSEDWTEARLVPDAKRPVVKGCSTRDPVWRDMSVVASMFGFWLENAGLGTTAFDGAVSQKTPETEKLPSG